MRCDEWKTVKLEDICELIPGFAFKSKDFGDFKNNVIKIADIRPPKVNMLNLEGIDITKYDEKKLQKFIVRENDFVLAMTGATIGKIGRIYSGTAYINQRVLMFKTLRNTIKDFVYYIVINRDFDQYIHNHIDSETAQPNISATTLGKYEFSIPTLITQKAIAKTLSCLDDKIELNNKINANLEQTAQAIFKSWFVDFEPFQDGEFVESELGRIPKGWRVGTLGDLCKTITKGTTPTTLNKQFTSSGINFIKAESILDNHSFDINKIAFIDDETNKMLSRSIIEKNDIVFTIAGTLGRFAFVDFSIIPANTNQAVAIIRANEELINPITLYSYFIGGWHTGFYTKNIQQAVQANISLTTIKSLPILIPQTDQMQIYSDLIKPIFNNIWHNNSEINKLKEVRDNLLPKLMSGKIDVSQV